MCPRGDDPLTVGQNDRSISLTVQSNNSYALGGELGIQLYGSVSYISLNRSADECAEAMAVSPQIDKVQCNITVVNSQLVNINITFLSWPSIFPNGNLFYNDGNPSLSDFFCDTSRVTHKNADCIFSNLVADNIKG